MANALKNRIWIVDTAHATNMVTTANLYVKKIRWVDEAGTAGDNAEIQDASGNVLWSSVEAGANYVEGDQVERWWYGGFKVPTLDGGILYIELL